MPKGRDEMGTQALMAGDIGGTKTILALYASDKGLCEPLRKETFSSSAYESLEQMIGEFLAQSGHTIDCAVFGVAGPVVGRSARITNLPWIIDAGSIGSQLDTGHAYLLNDLQAVALGIPLLEPSDILTLNHGIKDEHGPIAVIAPGTGLGEAYLTWDGTRYLAHASEGGHCDFAPRDQREQELLAYLLERFDHVSYERVCSGSGIPNIYAFLRDKGYCEEPSWFALELDKAKDVTILIRETAQSATRGCDLCRETLALFVSILGAEAGNLALKTLPTGGLYLGGGLSPRIIPSLQGKAFLDAFFSKGRLSDILRRMPVHVILNTDIGLMGAAAYGMDVIQNRHEQEACTP